MKIKVYKTKKKNLTIRTTSKKDVTQILNFIKQLAKYEKMSRLVTATEKTLEKSIFKDHKAEVLLLEFNHKPIGFALFFETFSTFIGKPNLYLEDVYIEKVYRNQGYGTQLFVVLAKIAKARKYQRFEWNCLRWNEPSLAFYKKLGAVTLDAWIGHRLTDKDYENLIKKA